MEERVIIQPSPVPSGADQPSSPMTAEQVYLEFGPRVYSMARRMLSNEADAEDVAQDVFTQVVRKLPEFRGESALPTWLHRVTVNAALAHRRKRAVRDQTQFASSATDLLEVGESDPPEERLLDEEQRALIDRGIAELPELYRNVLVLSDIEERSNADIAAELGLTVPAVKSRLHRARLLLRDKLAPHFEYAGERSE